MRMDSEGGREAGERRRVLVTGSNRGIGLELVRQYAHDGYDVVATCRDPGRATDLHGIRGAVVVHRLDVTSESDLEAVVAAIDGSPIDILVCNAAVFGGARSRLADVDWAAWRDAFEVNVLGSIRVALRLWPNVAASTQRKIVFVSSRAGLPREATPNRSYIYTSSKAALNSAARGLALDLASEGVITALVNPGHVQTGIGGAQAPMTVAESVEKVRKVIAGLTADDTGKFLHFDGTELKL
jgi:NAD(P)-dependent dehydrogenase (short-subunit alcohol dehydrogenase family)